MITGYCSEYFHSDRANDADRLIHINYLEAVLNKHQSRVILPGFDQLNVSLFGDRTFYIVNIIHNA